MSEIYRILLAPNPSALTGPGTNTIILGDARSGATVIDPAVDDAEYLAAIVQEGQSRGGIRRILISHGHPDHIGGAEALRARLDVPILAFSRQGVPFADEEIADNTPFACGDDTLRTLYTPGHRFDHLCFWLEQQRILFAGDLVASHGTVVIPPPPQGDLYDYLQSLQRVQNLDIVSIVPAHGEVITRPQEKLAEYIAHRQKREQQILAILQNAPQGVTNETIVQSIYTDIDASLHALATLSVQAHLSKLEREGRVQRIATTQRGQQEYWQLSR